MIDFVIGLALAGLAVRGWMRGFAREAMDLVGLVLGLVLAFRLGSPLGDELASRFGMAPEAARIVASVTIFLVVGVGTAIAARYLSRALSLPGLNLANRVFGVVLALAWGTALLILVVSLVRVAPLPSPVDQALDDSRVVSAVTAPDSMSQQVFHAVAGDRVVESVLNLDRVVGLRVVVDESEQATLPPADPDELEVGGADAREVYDLLNRARLEAGEDPLAWSGQLARVGRLHAREMYRRGYFSHQSPDTGSPLDRVTSAGIQVVRVGENLALAATPLAAHQGLMDSPGHRRNLLDGAWTQVGVGVIEGPLGLMVVQVFSD